MADRNSLTHARLREALHYDPLTGVFTWTIRTSMCVRIGDVAGTVDSDGYRRIKLDGRIYLAHRLAWFYVHGVWPSNDIDHRFGLVDDNRISELRDLTRSGNLQNMRKPGPRNKSGFLGVSWSKVAKKWAATIHVNNKKIHLGYHHAPEVAHAAYLAAKRRLHPSCTI